MEARKIIITGGATRIGAAIAKKLSGKNIEILIAGCGTGQHAITTASKYKNAEIFALDLSFNSLAYAKRKAEELNCKNINFIQGDLLDLRKLNKKFDIIESVGVLHHMADPLVGWECLTDCLKKDSLMLIGLYSEKARENIANIREKIKSFRIKTTKKNIIPIINGEIILPKKIPNLNQSLFKGFKILEFNNPKTRKITEIIKDHILISPLLTKG